MHGAEMPKTCISRELPDCNRLHPVISLEFPTFVRMLWQNQVHD
jgi:hypothetical protein